MAEAVKNIYSIAFFNRYAEVLSRIIPAFEKKLFIKEIYNDEWDKKELKQRMRHISNVLKNHLSPDYKTAVSQLLQSIDILIKEGETEGVLLGRLEYIFITDYIEQNGMEDFETSIMAFEKITPFSSCEFGVRPFIIRYGQKMLDVMYQWTQSKDEKIRRLASEGSRSHLPWAMAIPATKEHTHLTLSILEKIKNDPSPYVRKSVANSLNDISKDHPDMVISIAKRWKGNSKETDWIIKHACRTLLKEGNKEILQLFGFGDIQCINITNLKLSNDKIRIGQYLVFTFDLINLSSKAEKIRLEYGIYYMKQNGSLARKIYMISEKEYKERSTTHILRRQSFKPVTTRKFHTGKHQVSLIINGNEVNKLDFELTH